MKKRPFLTNALALSALFGLGQISRAQARTLSIVVPFAAGGTTDILARVIAPELSSAQRSVTVDNKPGASGNVGAEFVSKGPSDGSMLLMGTVGTHAINRAIYPSLPYDPVKDFTPLVFVAGVPNVLVMTTERAEQLKIKTAIDLLRHAKNNPGKLNVASSGNGTSLHLAGELFKSMTGTYLVHFAHNGAAAAVAGLLSGKMDVMFDNLPSALPLIRSGKLVALGVTSAQRSEALAGVPTIAEATGLKDYEASSWFGLFARSNVSTDITARMTADLVQVLERPNVRRAFAASGAVPRALTGAAFAQYIAAETTKWAAVVKRSGARLEERSYIQRS